MDVDAVLCAARARGIRVLFGRERRLLLGFCERRGGRIENVKCTLWNADLRGVGAYGTDSSDFRAGLRF